MAQLTGYVCDVCERFNLSKANWLNLSSDNGGKFDICSNRCLVVLARKRVAADKDNPNANGEKKAQPFTAKGRNLSDEDKLVIVEEAIANGVKVTADAHSLPWQAVARWKSELS